MADADNLDAFLDFIDADPEYDSEDEPGTSTKNKSPENVKNGKKELTFEDVFGSPIKKKGAVQISKDEPCSSSKSNSQTQPLINSQNSTVSQPSFVKGIRKRVGALEGPSFSGNSRLHDGTVVLDPFSRLRLFKTSITLYTDEIVGVEAALKDRNMGIQYVNLMSFKYWYNCSGGKDQKTFWTGGVVVKKQSGVRKSANGNDYTIWEINNLMELDKNWTVFLFGTTGASPSLSSVAIGSYIDLISPSIMDSPSGMKFSVNNVSQIRHIGTSKDFGYCPSKRKDGKPCTGIVNTAECNVCIYHASAELKKIHGKTKAAGKQKLQNPKSVQFVPTTKKADGVVTVDFGKPPAVRPENQAPKTVRMSLQDPNNTLKRNTMKSGNHSSISFEKEKHEFLELEPAAKRKKMDLVLDPLKTRHLTEKDRAILEALGGTPAAVTSDIPAMIAANPNAGGRNFMQYLNRKQFQLDNSRADDDARKTNEMEPITMTRETLRNMQKALSFVKKNGPIKKMNPNTVAQKRKFSEMNSSSSKTSTSKATKNDLELSVDSEEYQKILNAKSAHADLLEDLQHDQYFDLLEKKEAIEKKLLSTFAIPTNAVMCRTCKYVALSRSDYCKEQQHQVRVVKATKRFFKCKDCGNRTMSLDRLPKHPCKNCNSSCWLVAPVGKERTGPVLPSERLSVRGDEEKFLGSASAKLFL